MFKWSLLATSPPSALRFHPPPVTSITRPPHIDEMHLGRARRSRRAGFKARRLPQFRRRRRVTSPPGARSRRRGARPSLIRWQPIQNALANHTQLAGLRLRQAVENERADVFDMRGSYPLQLSISRAGQSRHRVPTVLRVGLPRPPAVLL